MLLCSRIVKCPITSSIAYYDGAYQGEEGGLKRVAGSDCTIGLLLHQDRNPDAVAIGGYLYALVKMVITSSMLSL